MDVTTIVSTEVILGAFRKIVYSQTFPSLDSLYKNTQGRSQCRHRRAWPACKHVRNAASGSQGAAGAPVWLTPAWKPLGCTSALQLSKPLSVIILLLPPTLRCWLWVADFIIPILEVRTRRVKTQSPGHPEEGAELGWILRPEASRWPFWSRVCCGEGRAVVSTLTMPPLHTAASPRVKTGWGGGA